MSANANIRAGRAYVEVTAETSKLKQNLNATQSQLRDFEKACQGQAMLREVSVESVDASGNLRKMAAVMRDIAIATAKMPTAKRLSFMKDVFDVWGMMSGITLADNIEEVDKFLARLKGVTGTAGETGLERSSGVGGRKLIWTCEKS